MFIRNQQIEDILGKLNLFIIFRIVILQVTINLNSLANFNNLINISEFFLYAIFIFNNQG